MYYVGKVEEMKRKYSEVVEQLKVLNQKLDKKLREQIFVEKEKVTLYYLMIVFCMIFLL
jgi:phage FluMu gp28-like protein